MALETSYGARPAGGPSQSASVDQGDGDYWPLSKLKKCYTDFLFNKRQELDEQNEARRYYHGSQWTEEQIKTMRRRKQPIMTFNRTARKIDGVVGLTEKLRQAPKAYARTPQHEQGAELATAAVRYVLDEQEWKAKSPICALDAAIDGVGGIELELTQGDQGDPEIAFSDIDIQSYFYDPRSFEPDFDDARYHGIGKWVDDDIAREMFPDADEGAFAGNSSELTNSSDREQRWFSQVGQQKRVRLIDIWYKHKGGWCWAIYTGSAKLMEGKSYFKDEKGKDFCKYIMFSGNVDQDGDRYGFVRNMKSAQDGINARQSKMQHILASRRLIISQGAVDDVEKVRAEWARPDGVVLTNRPVNEGVKADDQSFDFAGWTKMLELNIAEIENFGPNHALTGDGGVEKNSGKAIQLLQQAGMAELGPYIQALRGWKIRVYRGVWNAIRQHWKGERWVRVTDDQDLAQYIQINGMGIGPDGQPTIVNAIGSLDVDIIMDEAPDATTLQMQSFEVMQALGPQFLAQFPQVVIDLAPLDQTTKKRMREQMQQAAQTPPPEVQIKQAELQAKEKEAMLGIQADREKNAGQLQAQREKHALDFISKKQQQDQDYEHQQRSQALEHEHEVRRQDNEHFHKTRESDQNMAVKREEHAMKIDAELQKHRMTIDNENEKAAVKEKGEAKVSAAPLKPLTDAIAGAVEKLADAVEEMAEGNEALIKAVSAPKKINITRSGDRITGGTATPIT